MAKESIKMDKTACLQKRIASILVVVVSLVTSQGSRADAPSSKTLLLDNPYWNAELDTGGYSDVFWWEQFSPRHNYTRHEMLSGEWGAAIYYDGIGTPGNKAMWLTDEFIFPDWLTNSDFVIDSDPFAEDDEDNPVVGYDTGHSRIKNGQVTVAIDYEMVDLGQQGENGEGGSPLSFGSLVGADAFVYSERYVLLQTYTITNTTDSPIENLEFYQMLHGHPAYEYNPVVYSLYDDTDHEDALEDYIPYNDVHREEGSIYAGNFRYDITQWNNCDDPDASKVHRDWIGFSSTVPPDFSENGYYEGHGQGKPPTGMHIRIEDRLRPIEDEPLSLGHVAGAMGWSLGTLAPAEQQGDSVKLTLAVMFGSGPIQRSCGELEAEAHWGLDETTGDVAHDWIGDNDGTLVGDPEWVYGGYIGGALEFDGDGDYVELSDPVGALTGESVTISAWVKPGDQMVSGKWYDIVSQTKGSPDYLFGYDLFLEIEDASGACLPGFWLDYPGCYARSGDAIPRDEWTWVVGTNDGATLKVYVNGQLKESADSTGRMGVYSNAYIGYLPEDPPFIGVIDCVWVFSCPWDPEQGCLPFCNEHYDQWFELGRPDCWCSSAVLGEDISDTGPPNYTAGDYQCDGDANTDRENPGLKWRVSASDLSLVIANWKKTADDETLNPCADIDHAEENPGLHWRVSASDLSIVTTHWKWTAAQLAGDCAERGCQGEALGGGSPGTQLTSKELLQWLAEIWLDPDVQKSIDHDKFLEVYESLKGL
jgi:hypothetical protein